MKVKIQRSMLTRSVRYAADLLCTFGIGYVSEKSYAVKARGESGGTLYPYCD